MFIWSYAMPIGLVGRKHGMTRIFSEDGVSIPVTVIGIENNRVAQVKTIENDGYRAVQITAGRKPASRVNKPLAGHYKKAGIEAGEGLWEFRLDDKAPEMQVGQEVTVELFKEGQMVDVTAISKGKGFAGVIKRHNFSSQGASHGNSLSERVHGSTGMNQSPGRVHKGKKMAGQLGNVRRTVQNQVIVKIDNARGLILVKGVVPGAPGGNVILKPSVKIRQETANGA